MLFWSILGASIGSALLPLINIEAILAVAVSQAPSSTWSLIVAATVGQMIGKILWYWGGMHLDRAPFVTSTWRSPRPRRHSRSGTSGPRVVRGSPPGCSSSRPFLGFPPYAITAVLAGVLRVHFVVFLVTGLLGRGLRFWALVAGTTSLLHLG